MARKGAREIYFWAQGVARRGLKERRLMCAFELLENWVDDVEECNMKESNTVATAVKSSWCSKLKLTERTGMPLWCFTML